MATAKKKVATKKKTAVKAAPEKNFVVLDSSMDTCCGERFATRAEAEKELSRHVNDNPTEYNYDKGEDVRNKYYIAQLIAVGEAAEEVPPAIITDL